MLALIAARPMPLGVTGWVAHDPNEPGRMACGWHYPHSGEVVVYGDDNPMPDDPAEVLDEMAEWREELIDREARTVPLADLDGDERWYAIHDGWVS